MRNTDMHKQEEKEYEIEEAQGEGLEEEQQIVPFSGRTERVTMDFDNEWVRLMDKLSHDSTLVELVEYLKVINLTPRAKNKLRILLNTLLDKEFAVTRIRNQREEWKVMDEFDIILADLPLGLCKYDMSPEFIHTIELLQVKFAAKILRSFGGFERKMMATQRSESMVEQNREDRDERRGAKRALQNIFGEKKI